MPATDPTVLAGLVHAVTRADVRQWSRIVVGEINEVYRATLTDGPDVIVRVSRSGRGGFHSERWVLDAAHAAGVPVPDVLSITDLEDEHGSLLVCIESCLAGGPMNELEDPAVRERVAGTAGELTATLHSVEVNGFGFVRADGTGPAKSWAQVMEPWPTDAAAAAAEVHADTCQVPRSWLHAAAAELARHRELFQPIDARLLHGDLCSAHVMTDGVAVTGFIDFEQAFSGDPTFEFVRWDYFRDDSPLEWLLAGYQRVVDLGPDLELRIKLGRLRLHLALVDFYAINDHPLAADVMRRHFAADAEWFGFASA